MKKQIRIGCLLVIAIASLLSPFASKALAQGDKGSVSGRVTDSAGAVIPKADITLVNQATKVESKLKSNGSGEFTFTDLNVGRYTMVITSPGFNTFKEADIQVDVDQRLAVNAALKVGDANVEVTIESNAQQLQTTSANLGMTIEEKSITDLPLVYGNPFALEYLAPGVVLSGVNPNSHVYDTTTSNVSVNGSLLNSIDYKLDGGTDNAIRVSAFTPNTESIAQYRLNTANYDATGGHASGGFVNLATKSGTDRIHGSVFMYYQNRDINANNWLLNPAVVAQSKAKFQRYGASVGGPILKQKAFFFIGVEHSVQGNPNANTVQVPTTAERNGDFSALLALDTNSAHLTCGTTPTALGAAGTVNSYQLFDPQTYVQAGTLSNARLCIPGNIIPASQISPVAKALFSYYPAPNGGTAAIGTYSYSVLNDDHYTGGVARFDYQVDQRQSLFAHLVRSSRSNLQPTTFGLISATHSDYENYSVSLGHTLVLSTSSVLTTNLSWGRFTNQNKNGDQGVVTPVTIGMSANLIAGLPLGAQALPRITPTGYTALNTTSYGKSADDTYLGSMFLAKQARSHYLRFGGEYRRFIVNGTAGTAENGNYTASGNTNTYAFTGANNSVGGAGFSIAALEYGLLDSGSQTQNSDFSTVEHYFAGFLQDDWRASARLTLNMGLRWEYESPIVERNNKMVVSFNPTATNSSTGPAAAAYIASGAASSFNAGAVAGTQFTAPAAINPSGGLVYANTLGYGRSAYTSPTHDFSPRLGFAFAANQKTVVRGGYALLFDSIETYLISGTNNGSVQIVPQIGYSQVSNVTGPVAVNNQVVYTSTLADPFPTGLNALTGTKGGYNTGLGQNLQFLQPNPHTPYNQRWSLGVQRQLGPFVASLDYVGNRGVHLFTLNLSQGTNTGGTEFNAIPKQYLSTYTKGLDEVEQFNLGTLTVPNPFYGILPANSVNSLSSQNIQIGQLLRPYPEFGSVNAYVSNGNSIYHALQAQLQRRFSKGLSVTSAFTWSRLLDASFYLNTADTRPWYGVSQQDRPLRYSGSFIYQLPWGHGRRYLAQSRGLLSQVVGGWQMQGIYQIQSGQPITFGSANNVYNGPGSPGDSHWSRASYKKTQYTNAQGPVGGLWFNTANWLTNGTSANPGANTQVLKSCISSLNATTAAATPYCPTEYPSAYQIHNFPLRFNNLRADHLNQADLGLQRQFQVKELGVLQFRAEALNLFNHVVYAGPSSTDPNSTAFGLIVAQGNAPRIFQFSGFFRF